MEKVANTKMSSKGQVVIPEAIRKALGFAPGAQFVVVGEGDVVVLKRISAPSMSDFEELLDEATRRAQRAGMKRSDIAAAVRAVRATR